MQSFLIPTLSLQELNVISLFIYNICNTISKIYLYTPWQLNFSEDEDDKEDIEDDKKMMRLLLKLKTAKESLDDTKRK